MGSFFLAKKLPQRIEFIALHVGHRQQQPSPLALWQTKCITPDPQAQSGAGRRSPCAKQNSKTASLLLISCWSSLNSSIRFPAIIPSKTSLVFIQFFRALLNLDIFWEEDNFILWNVFNWLSITIFFEKIMVLLSEIVPVLSQCRCFLWIFSIAGGFRCKPV